MKAEKEPEEFEFGCEDLTKDWLDEISDLEEDVYKRQLEISPEKSKVINLKEQYSEFLGFKLKVIPRGKRSNGHTKYVVESLSLIHICQCVGSGRFQGKEWKEVSPGRGIWLCQVGK